MMISYTLHAIRNESEGKISLTQHTGILQQCRSEPGNTNILFVHPDTQASGFNNSFAIFLGGKLENLGGIFPSTPHILNTACMLNEDNTNMCHIIQYSHNVLLHIIH